MNKTPADKAGGNLLKAFHRHVETGDRLGLGAVLADMARTANAAGKYARAACLSECALTVFRALDHRLGQACALKEQGEALFGLKQTGAAFPAFYQARELFRAVGNKAETARCDAIFAHLEAENGKAVWAQAEAAMKKHAEGVRLMGLESVRKTADEDELLREIAGKLRSLGG